MERQEAEMSSLQNSLKRMSDEFIRSQVEIMGWTRKNFDEMKQENTLLKMQLGNYKEQFDNFQYNIQVYVFINF